MANAGIAMKSINESTIGLSFFVFFFHSLLDFLQPFQNLK